MIGITIYLAIGLVVLGLIAGAHLRERRSRPSNWAKRTARELRGLPPATPGLLERVGVPLLTALLIIVAWPGAVWLQARKLGRPKFQHRQHPGKLVLTREHLIQRLAIAEIEHRERIVDPLGAAPNEPFGLRHRDWQDFLAARRIGESIWSFTAPWPGSTKGYNVFGLTASGYVYVRFGRTGRFIVSHLSTR
jgi:hypothetical protein